MAVEWQLSGSCFLQAVVAGISYVRNRASAGKYLGALRAAAARTLCGEVHTCGSHHCSIFCDWPAAMPGSSEIAGIVHTHICREYAALEGNSTFGNPLRRDKRSLSKRQALKSLFPFRVIATICFCLRGRFFSDVCGETEQTG